MASCGREKKLEIEVNGSRLSCPDIHGLEDGQNVVMGVRPEHLEIAQGGENNLPVLVSLIEPTGAETHVITKFGDHDFVAVFRERHNFKPGQKINLTAKSEFIHLFDASSGKRLRNDH